MHLQQVAAPAGADRVAAGRHVDGGAEDNAGRRGHRALPAVSGLHEPVHALERRRQVHICFALRCLSDGLSQVQHDSVGCSVAQHPERQMVMLDDPSAGSGCRCAIPCTCRLGGTQRMRASSAAPCAIALGARAAQAVPVQCVHAAQRGADGVLCGPGPGRTAPGRGGAPGAQPRDRRLRGSPRVHGEPVCMSSTADRILVTVDAPVGPGC